MGRVEWSEETKAAQAACDEALEKYLRLAHADRLKAGYFGDPTTWDEEEREQAVLDHKAFTSWAVSGQFQSLAVEDTVNVVYGIRSGQSPVTTKGLFAYAYEAYK